MRGKRIARGGFELDSDRPPMLAAGFLAITDTPRIVFDPVALEHGVAVELTQ